MVFLGAFGMSGQLFDVQCTCTNNVIHEHMYNNVQLYMHVSKYGIMMVKYKSGDSMYMHDVVCK